MNKYIMDDKQEQHPFNKAAWEVIDKYTAMYNDGAKPFLSLIRNILGIDYPITITDKEFLEIMTSKKINENTRAEVLNKLAESSVLTIGETIKLIQMLTENLAIRVLNKEEEELTMLQKCKLHNISKN